jgi:hypothetical protein
LVERLQIEAFPEKSVRSLDVIDALFDWRIFREVGLPKIKKKV